MEWVRSSVQQTGITEVVLSGGVFMNVKANMAIMEMPEITNVTVCPSGADESTPIGAALGNTAAEPDPVPPRGVSWMTSTSVPLSRIVTSRKRWPDTTRRRGTRSLS